MNNRLSSCGIFIDLKKAFNIEDHEILLRKLDYYGFRGIINIWFSSYLQERTQTTQIGLHISERLDSTCGVPQGSVLVRINLCSKKTVDNDYFCRRDPNLNLDLLTEITENGRNMTIDKAATQNQPSFNLRYFF